MTGFEYENEAAKLTHQIMLRHSEKLTRKEIVRCIDAISHEAKKGESLRSRGKSNQQYRLSKEVLKLKKVNLNNPEAVNFHFACVMLTAEEYETEPAIDVKNHLDCLKEIILQQQEEGYEL